MIENLRLLEEASNKVETYLVWRPALAVTDLGFHQFISGKQFFNRKHHLQGHRGDSRISQVSDPREIKSKIYSFRFKFLVNESSFFRFVRYDHMGLRLVLGLVEVRTMINTVAPQEMAMQIENSHSSKHHVLMIGVPSFC